MAEHGSQQCPEEPALEALLLMQLPIELQEKIERHVLGCAKCQRHLEQLRAENRQFSAALGRLEDVPSGACPDALDLAAFLDGAGDEAWRAQQIGHFAGCDSCRRALVNLHLETQALLQETEEVAAPEGPSVTASRKPIGPYRAPATLTEKDAGRENDKKRINES